MILYKGMKQEDFDGVNDLLQAHDLSAQQFMASMHNATILVIDQKICGFATYKMMDNDTAKLQVLLVDKQERGKQYGDGLLKAMLSSAEQRGIFRVYADTLAVEPSFLEHLGFDSIDQTDAITNLMMQKDASLSHFTQLPEFFDTACKSKVK